MLPRLLAICVAIALVALAIPSAVPALLAYVNPNEAAVATTESDPLPLSGQIAIAADSRGHFLADAEIDGHTVRVMIDTGATTVALTAATARRLGLHLTSADYTASIQTANGIARAAPVQLATVRIGNVTVRDVSATVAEGDALELNLLGMSFLSRLTRFGAGGGQLVLVQ